MWKEEKEERTRLALNNIIISIITYEKHFPVNIRYFKAENAF